MTIHINLIKYLLEIDLNYNFINILSPIDEIKDFIGPNNLPYEIPIHPNLVHLTIGLFAIAIAFDFAGAIYPFEKRILRFLAFPVTRVGFHDVGWYNIIACSLVTFFTVATGFFEILLAVPITGQKSLIGQDAITTMIWHGVGGVVILMVLVLMTIWRGYLRFILRKDYGRQVSWSYLSFGILVLLIMALHGSLGAWLASDFGVHITADQLISNGYNLSEIL